MIDNRSYTHNLGSCEIKDLKKLIHSRFEPMTFTVLVQTSAYKLSYQAMM